jgi:uncharacterized protein (TIGR02145 family)
MRFIVIIFSLLLFSIKSFSQNIGIGTENPNPSAALDITDNTRGLLIPRMTKAQRLNINTPAEGLYVYQTDDSKGFWYFDGTNWVSFLKLPPGAAQNKVITYCDGELTWTIGGRCPAKISSLNCSSSTPTGTLVSNTVANAVSSAVDYTDGNAGFYDELVVNSTGVTGLTATLAAGALAEGDGSLTFIISGTPSSSGTASFAINAGGVSCTLTRIVYEPAIISTINCGSPTNQGSLSTAGEASGVSTTIGYTGGNGGGYQTQTISSTGVQGLTATLNAGQLANGSGSIIFTITGTPTEGGKASFQVNIGGQNCSFSRNVASDITLHACGSDNVHNPSVGYGIMLDQENNNYRTVRIGAQTWMAENLKTTIYRNGDPISQVANKSSWEALDNGAYCYFNNDASKDCPYGKLYNWYAVSDSRNICPNGWHVPTESDWVVLENYLGGFGAAGGKMRSTGTQYWLTANAGATNESGFSGLPGGYRSSGVTDFYNFGNNAIWWSSTSFGAEFARYRGTLNTGNGQLFFGAGVKINGYSVRCIKDAESSDAGTLTAIDCNSASNTGDIYASTEITAGVTSTLSYTGGNEGIYEGQSISSTGVTGLTAILIAGTFTNGSGTLSFEITGTPGSSGTASFEINIGGQTCTLTRSVGIPDPLASHNCGSTYVHNVTLPYGSMTDQQGNQYRTIRIGAQNWMAENLKTTIYRNGDPVPMVETKAAWQELTTGAYSYYENNSSNNCPYGKLYNWYAATDSRNICPLDWHVPTEEEWIILENYLGGFALAGGKMRSTGTSYWSLFNGGATNESGFSGLPGGYRAIDLLSVNDFLQLKGQGVWWASTPEGTEYARYRGMSGGGETSLFSGATLRGSGYSIRCVQDPDVGSITGLNCAAPVNTGELTNGTIITSGVSSTISYTGGNQGAYSSQAVSSTGVTGLTATLVAGTFANGSGNLILDITGTPATIGTASFVLTIGGQTCTLNRTVTASDPLAYHSCGSTYVHNVSLSYGNLTDQEGNQYKTIQIGTQEWMAENLKTSKYRNGDPIPEVENKTTWFESTTGAHCFYDNDATKNCPYGKLYNWYAVSDNRNICPTGWHVPTTIEWQTLEDYLGGFSQAGNKMRTTGIQYWLFFNEGATNESGFSALPGGYRAASPQLDFYNLGYSAIWWSSSIQGTEFANYRGTNNQGNNWLFSGAAPHNQGYSIRCIKD